MQGILLGQMPYIFFSLGVLSDFKPTESMVDELEPSPKFGEAAKKQDTRAVTWALLFQLVCVFEVNGKEISLNYLTTRRTQL